jgi:hypothetical protein
LPRFPQRTDAVFLSLGQIQLLLKAFSKTASGTPAPAAQTLSHHGRSG